MSDRITVGQMFPNKVTHVPAHRINSNPQTVAGNQPFQQIFENNFLKFSQHAEMRLQQRGIRFQPEQLSKIESAVDKAAAKGAKDSLILVQDTALIVNVKNRTVITALDGASMKDNVFTQIDSAIIIS